MQFLLIIWGVDPKKFLSITGLQAKPLLNKRKYQETVLVEGIVIRDGGYLDIS